MRYYLERRDAEFEQKMAEMLCVYREVQVPKKAARSKKSGKPVAIVSYDEKPGIQAIATTGRPDHCITFHFTPRHASWLNQIEIWFSILVRKLICHGDFASKNDLRAKIKQFIAYLNATMAKPFRWTMAAKPLTG